MGPALPYIALAATATTISQGRAEKKAANKEAAQLEAQGKQDRAIAQLDAREERKRAELLQSRLRALAGTSGTAATSPDIINQEAEISAQGTYNALAALYSGQSSERSKQLLANARKREGKKAEQQSYYRAASNVISSDSFADWVG